MSAMYAVCKVKSVDLRFKTIVTSYKNMPNTSQEVTQAFKKIHEILSPWFLLNYLCLSVSCRPLSMCWSLRTTTTPSSSSTTRCSCRSWKPTSSSMPPPGWGTFPIGVTDSRRINSLACDPLSLLILFLFLLSSPLPSLQSHKYHAAPINFPIPLYVCLGATMCTSPLWKAHACLLESWLLAPGESSMLWQIDVLLWWLNWLVDNTMNSLCFFLLQDVGINRWIFWGMCLLFLCY